MIKDVSIHREPRWPQTIFRLTRKQQSRQRGEKTRFRICATVLRREYDEILKRLPFKARVEKRILKIEEMIARDLQGL